MVIDSHQHFWKFDPVRDSWITEEMSVIRNDFMPEDLLCVLKTNGVDGCIAVQADQSEAQNDFLITLSKQYEFIKGVVGWVDLQAANIEERLQHYQGVKKVKGFRHVLQGEKQRDFMLRDNFKNGIGLLDHYNFTYDILIFPDQLGYSEELVSLFPNQRFVVDHIAKPDIKNGLIDEWKTGIEKLARHENVFCKISGMITEADWKSWKKENFTRYLDVAVKAFGTKRIMYGSDWPVCLVAGSYERMKNIVEEYFASFSKNEQEYFFGKNAVKFYNLQ